MRHPFGETVQRIPYLGEGEDAHGNSSPLFGDPISIEFVAVAPTATEETLAAGERVTDKITLYVEPDSKVENIDPRDRFFVRGDTYSVCGSFLNWVNPFDGNNPGGTIYVERVTG